jgi:hypothetical protein
MNHPQCINQSARHHYCCRKALLLLYEKVFALTFFIISVLLLSQEKRPVPDIMLTNYQYPYPVQFLDFKSQNQDLKMAYMDIKPEKPNGKTVILLHGKTSMVLIGKQRFRH